MSRGFALLFALLVPVTLRPQRPDTTMVPRELAIALVAMSGFSSGSQASITVGRLPDERLAPLVPRGARVVGGVSDSDRRSGGTTTILAMPESPDSALTLVVALLERAGFKPAPTLESTRGGAFVMLGASVPGQVLTYCSDSGSIFASVTEGQNRGAIVRLVSTRSLRNSMCDPEMRERMYGRFEQIELPNLRLPAGATGGRMGSSGSDHSRESETEIRSSLSAAEMIDHFAPQLREQGWTLTNRATDGDLSVQTARRIGPKGEPLFLMLSDNRYGPREHAVTLRVWAEQSRYR